MASRMAFHADLENCMTKQVIIKVRKQEAIDLAGPTGMATPLETAFQTHVFKERVNGLDCYNVRTVGSLIQSRTSCGVLRLIQMATGWAFTGGRNSKIDDRFATFCTTICVVV